MCCALVGDSCLELEYVLVDVETSAFFLPSCSLSTGFLDIITVEGVFVISISVTVSFNPEGSDNQLQMKLCAFSIIS